MSNSTSAECPSLDTRPALPGANGESMLVTFGCASSRPTTSRTAAWNRALVAVSEELWRSTSSLAGCLNSSLRIRWTRPDSPGPGSFADSDLVPTIWPTPKAITTNASQPNTAAFQCLALHRPTRVARFSLWTESATLASPTLAVGGDDTPRWPPGQEVRMATGQEVQRLRPDRLDPAAERWT